ncbi:LAMI_0A08768g1_1 [Lachancea mirantina]|uniref:LAMI_0A08768g1_1 n=1 Tax=Lachancea mirantina TaxID=1230905 RepID=A0A1G4IS62_9SACH|nr:LAMI_0A08768g1_1 [Lachancea mirantina]
MILVNEFGQVLGEELRGWYERSLPEKKVLVGKYCKLEPLDFERHGKALFDVLCGVADKTLWTYLPLGPFDKQGDFEQGVKGFMSTMPQVTFAVIDIITGSPVGLVALMRPDTKNGSIEIGLVTFSRVLQRTSMSTEVHFLLLEYVFDSLKYRRCEWRCNSLNEPSARAAERLGFQYEGLFRQAAVAKGCNRDTKWFSILDVEWPELKESFEIWLSEDNFNCGQQRKKLSEIRQGLKMDSSNGLSAIQF